MAKKGIIAASIICVLVFIVILFFAPKPAVENTLYPSRIKQKIFFKKSGYAADAYQIAPGTLDEKAKKALDGFALTKKRLSNGSIEISLSPLKYGYEAYTLVVRQGYTLYFIEANTDDDTKGFDSTLGDDRPVLVDPQGYVVE